MLKAKGVPWFWLPKEGCCAKEEPKGGAAPAAPPCPLPKLKPPVEPPVPPPPAAAPRPKVLPAVATGWPGAPKVVNEEGVELPKKEPPVLLLVVWVVAPKLGVEAADVVAVPKEKTDVVAPNAMGWLVLLLVPKGARGPLPPKGAACVVVLPKAV